MYFTERPGPVGALSSFPLDLFVQRFPLLLPEASKTFFVRPCLINGEEDATPHQSGSRLQEDVMHRHEHLWRSLFGKAALATAALSAFLLLAGAPSAKANDWDRCNRRVAYVEFRLHESIAYFGYYSPQANYWRHERHEAFERLERYRRREWREREWREHERREHRRDEDGRRYHRDRDHDRDRDRD